MAEYSGDLVAAWAFDIHEVRIGALNQSFFLVLSFLKFMRRMEKILCERHFH
uniref:Uncharacterized protein n=2 Tax=Anguilla anguilla TaxID=7936 RepID=A0A0E9X978_ANGAN